MRNRTVFLRSSKLEKVHAFRTCALRRSEAYPADIGPHIFSEPGLWVGRNPTKPIRRTANENFVDQAPSFRTHRDGRFARYAERRFLRAGGKWKHSTIRH